VNADKTFVVTALVTLLSMVAVPTLAATINGDNNNNILRGTNKADILKGLNGNDELFGYAGNDKLYGGRGNDTIYGSHGNDNLYGWKGTNYMTGGPGNDLIMGTGDASSDTDGVDTAFGQSGNDYMQIQFKRANASGGAGMDEIHIGAEYEEGGVAHGDSGNDRMFVQGGAAGYGDSGNDYIQSKDAASAHGGSGNDYIDGVEGSLDLPHWWGDLGADTFNCHGSEDVNIHDYTPSQGDRLIDCPEGVLESGKETSTAENDSKSANIDFNNFESVQFLKLDDGIVYAIWQDRSVGNGDVFFAKSEDGGETYEEPINLSNNEKFALLDMAIAATDGGNVYVAWIDFEGNDPPEDAGMISFARSADGGETFDDAITLGEENIMDRNNLQMQASGDSSVHIMWIADSFEEFAGQLAFAASEDAGETFDTAELVNGELAVTQAGMAVGSDGAVYVAGQWLTSRDVTEGNDRVFFQRSTDSGQTFEDPVVIDTASSGGFANFESIVVEDGGSVRVTWIKGETFDESATFSSVSTDGGETFSEPEEQ
jgi:hypothetical protein